MDEADEERTPAPGSVPKLARWLLGAGLLVGFAAAGEALRALTHLPVPGSTLGMILLLAVLLLPRPPSHAHRRSCRGHPHRGAAAAAGAAGRRGDRRLRPLAEHAMAIIAALVVGWLATFLTAAFTADLLMRRVRRS